MNGDKDKEKMYAVCDSIADQGWMEFDSVLEEVVRIGIRGPRSTDSPLVKRVFTLFGYELARRREERKKLDVT